jgi:hypothetical protein
MPKKTDSSHSGTPLRRRLARDPPPIRGRFSGSPENRYYPGQVQGSSGESRLNQFYRGKPDLRTLELLRT